MIYPPILDKDYLVWSISREIVDLEKEKARGRGGYVKLVSFDNEKLVSFSEKFREVYGCPESLDVLLDYLIDLRRIYVGRMPLKELKVSFRRKKNVRRKKK